jgi:hypothetical protein
MHQEAPIQAETVVPSQEGIQPGLAARTEAMQAITQARENLGSVAAGPVVQANGEVTTPHDRAEELRVRQESGHAYQR